MEYPVIDVAMTGERIHELCVQKNVSVKSLQRYLGLSCPQTIYRWFKGKALPSLDNLFALSRMLGCAMGDLLVEKVRWEITVCECVNRSMAVLKYYMAAVC